MNGPTLTAKEQAHTLAALRHLHRLVGNWDTLAKALGFASSSLKNARMGIKRPSIALAYRVSRIAGAPFDDVVKGRWPVPGTCPHCGRGPG